MKIKNAVMTLLSILIILTVSVVSAEKAKYPEEQSHIGTVLLTEDTAKYTYMKLDENGKEVWIAAQHMKVSVGDKVEYTGGVLMKDFKSKALKKTFDYIRLIAWIRVLNGDPLSEQDNDDYKSSSMEKYMVTAPLKGEISKAEGGRTIEEIFSEKDQLRGKEVIIKGKVTNVINNILGKTWVTLKDGTGLRPDNKIIAVTLEGVDIGDVLTVKGILQTNVNLGSGYKYKLLIDEAKFTK